MKFHSVSKPFFIAFLIVALTQLACGLGASPNASPPQPSGGGGGASGGSDQIVISGAFSKSYPPVRPSIGQFGPSAIRLYLYEETPADLSRMGDALTIDFPADTQPGTYTFGNFISDPSITMWATYGIADTNGTPTTYESVGGILTIKSVGQTYSGSFQIQAADMNDPSRTIQISGSFTNLPLNQ